MPDRRILRLVDDRITVATEARIPSEQRLHRAIAEHPEVLPNEDLGIGTLVSLASEVLCEGGYIDLLAVDASGRLAIIEFKKGSENRDVRKVVAQLLDYGSSLWRMSEEDLVDACHGAGESHFKGSLTSHMVERLSAIDDEPFDPERFHAGLATTLEKGDFVFVYVARDLDEKTRRIITYLAEGPNMTFFAVEVEHYAGSAQNESILVPRTAYVPPRVAAGEEAGAEDSISPKERLAKASVATQKAVELLDGIAQSLGVRPRFTKASRIYALPDDTYGISAYFGEFAGLDFDLACFRDAGRDDLADEFMQRIESFSDRPITARKWPKALPEKVVARWDEARAALIEPYFTARRELKATARPEMEA